MVAVCPRVGFGPAASSSRVASWLSALSLLLPSRHDNLVVGPRAVGQTRDGGGGVVEGGTLEG